MVMSEWVCLSLLTGVLVGAKVGASFLGLTSSTVIDLNSDNFQKEVLDSDLPTFVEFYAPWCFHCRRLVPIWEDYAEKMKGRLQIGRVDCTRSDGLRRKYRIDAYPTLKLFMRGKTKDYHGSLNEDSFNEYLSHNALRNRSVYETNPVSLHYFEYRGEAEVIRLCLEAMGIPYKDVRYKDTKDFLAALPSLISNPSEFPPVDKTHLAPIISMGNIVIMGMTPILRHIGNEFDLYGEDDIVVADEIDEIIHNLNEFRQAYLDVVGGDCVGRRAGEIFNWVVVSDMVHDELNGMYSSINPNFNHIVRDKNLKVLYEEPNGHWMWYHEDKTQWLLGNRLDEVGTGKGLAFLHVDQESPNYQEQTKYPSIVPQDWYEVVEDNWIQSSGVVSDQSEDMIDNLELITPISAVAISSYSSDQSPKNLVNGQGLHDEPPFDHDNNRNANSMWHTADAIDPASAWIIFDFGVAQETLTGVVVWNLNQPGKALTAGITRFTMSYSEDLPEKQWKTVGDFNLDTCTGESQCAGQKLMFDTEIKNARHIKFSMMEVASGLENDFVGLSEVRFFGQLSDSRRIWQECKYAFKTKLMKWISYMDQLVEKNERKGNHLTGSPLESIADFYGFDLISLQISLFDNKILKETRHLEQWYEKLGTGDLLVDYMISDRRPQYANPAHYFIV